MVIQGCNIKTINGSSKKEARERGREGSIKSKYIFLLNLHTIWSSDAIITRVSNSLKRVLEISDSSALVCLQKVFVFLVRESSGICKAKLRHTVPQFSCTQLTSSLSLSLSLSLPLSHTQIKKQEEKRISWIAVILESLTLEIMKEVALQGKARRAIQTSLSNRREALVLLNWKRSDYMAKWVVITIPPFTVLLTLQLSTRRYLSPFPSPPLSWSVLIYIIKLSFYRVCRSLWSMDLIYKYVGWYTCRRI